MTASVAVVTKLYVPSGLIGNGYCLAHTKLPSVVTFVITSVIVVVEEVEVTYEVSDVVVLSVTDTAPSFGLHLPCTSSPLTVVLTTNSSSPSKSVFLTVTVR